MGKGSGPRPFDIPREQFRDNFDAIFRKKQPAEQEKKQEQDDKKPT